MMQEYLKKFGKSYLETLVFIHLAIVAAAIIVALLVGPAYLVSLPFTGDTAGWLFIVVFALTAVAMITAINLIPRKED